MGEARRKKATNESGARWAIYVKSGASASFTLKSREPQAF